MDNRESKYLISGVWLNNIHRFRTRIYYDATDAGGIVYHADYLTLAEHARTESLRSCEINQIDILVEQGVSLAVRHCSIDYKKPIGNGIITCLNMKQAKKRKIKGAEATNAVLSVLSQK